MRPLGGVLVLALLFSSASAHDPDGKYAQANPELHKWVEGLKSTRGYCCSNADGIALTDVDWQTQNKSDSHFRVNIDGQWVDVMDDAVITEPNRLGKVMVWPIRSVVGISIRCFLPGPEG